MLRQEASRTSLLSLKYFDFLNEETGLDVKAYWPTLFMLFFVQKINWNIFSQKPFYIWIFLVKFFLFKYIFGRLIWLNIYFDWTQIFWWKKCWSKSKDFWLKKNWLRTFLIKPRGVTHCSITFTSKIKLIKFLNILFLSLSLLDWGCTGTWC